MSEEKKEKTMDEQIRDATKKSAERSVIAHTIQKIEEEKDGKNEPLGRSNEEWFYKRMESIIEDTATKMRKIEKQVKAIQSNQLEIAEAIQDIWTFLIQSQVEVDEWFSYRRYREYLDSVKEMKNQKEEEDKKE